VESSIILTLLDKNLSRKLNQNLNCVNWIYLDGINGTHPYPSLLKSRVYFEAKPCFNIQSTHNHQMLHCQ